MNRTEYLANVRRMVVKVGTAVVTNTDGSLNSERVAALAEQVDHLVSAGRQVVLVTSGAIGAGIGELGLKERPKELPGLQAAAAVGQSHLIEAYNRCFKRHGHHAAQILVTRDDFDDRTRYLNVRNALNALFELGAIPVVNENDTVSVDEIRFGDNDLLSALVASLLDTQLLVLLTTVDGLLDGKEVVSLVDRVTEETLALDNGGKSLRGTGGMRSKLEAVGMVAGSGQAAIIANGTQQNVLPRLMAGEKLGTFFVSGARRTPSWKRWFAARTLRGTIHVDVGARTALVEGGNSLLPSGIVAVTGSFEQGDTVEIVGPDGKAFARGMTNLSSADLERIKGMRSRQVRNVLGDAAYTEAVHRDNLLVRK